jgi:hypothetical protein
MDRISVFSRAKPPLEEFKPKTEGIFVQKEQKKHYF